eukprot:scaffold14903_cov107-Isochrysis_galbana.AAC.1
MEPTFNTLIAPFAEPAPPAPPPPTPEPPSSEPAPAPESLVKHLAELLTGGAAGHIQPRAPSHPN